MALIKLNGIMITVFRVMQFLLPIDFFVPPYIPGEFQNRFIKLPWIIHVHDMPGVFN